MKSPEDWVDELPEGDEKWALHYIRSLRRRSANPGFPKPIKQGFGHERDQLKKFVKALQSTDAGKLHFITMDNALRKRKARSKDPRRERRVLLEPVADRALRDLARQDNLRYSDVVTQLVLTTKEAYVEARDSISKERKALSKRKSDITDWKCELQKRKERLDEREQELDEWEKSLAANKQRLRGLFQALLALPEDVFLSLEFLEGSDSWVPVVRTQEGTATSEEQQRQIQDALGPYLYPGNKESSNGNEDAN